MIEYILNYLESKGQIITSAAEEAAVETGISLYLEENGIDSEEKREYFRRYIDRHLALIAPVDLKSYFVEYPTISKVKQIAIEQAGDGSVPPERVAELYTLMEKLNAAGLYNKYIPAVEVKSILGRYS